MLMSQLPNNEELLHTAQMELLPSRQALNELVMWMDGVDAGLEEDDRLTAASLVDVQILVQKYRVCFLCFLIEIFFLTQLLKFTYVQRVNKHWCFLQELNSVA